MSAVKKFQILVEQERLGSGDGERKTLLTRQMPYVPPACIRFVRPWLVMDGFHLCELVSECCREALGKDDALLGPRTSVMMTDSPARML